ncbi:hypothetical protein SVIO_066150 [Streptomyces violaceusniger]|uniref:Membrane transport protein MMPL domain-containing protein n=1 Tax=Streptomyces violaceusniger TaxID=68280 RepID=A0A4D4L4C4_STRVO|nr:hypothetical protein SVIO_066150 [Streptomyces violaceusniger]
MATFLYKLGRFAFRRRGFVALIWVALLAVAGVGAATASQPANDSFSIPGTEAQKAFDLLEQRFPGVTRTAPPPVWSSAPRAARR